MKKFLKILLIIIGIVFLIFAALICIGLFVDYDDHRLASFDMSISLLYLMF